MKVFKSATAISSLILLSLFFAACNTDTQQTGVTESTTTNNTTAIIYAEWASYYQDISELILDADLIAYGEIDRVVEVQKINISHTDFGFRINQLLKGDETKEAVIHQLGAAGIATVIDDPVFEQGEEYILFLHKTEAGIYCVLGGPQGRFKVADGKVYSMDNIISYQVLISPELSFNGVDLRNFIGYIIEKAE